MSYFIVLNCKISNQEDFTLPLEANLPRQHDQCLNKDLKHDCGTTKSRTPNSPQSALIIRGETSTKRCQDCTENKPIFWKDQRINRFSIGIPTREHA